MGGGGGRRGYKNSPLVDSSWAPEEILPFHQYRCNAPPKISIQWNVTEGYQVYPMTVNSPVYQTTPTLHQSALTIIDQSVAFDVSGLSVCTCVTALI